MKVRILFFAAATLAALAGAARAALPTTEIAATLTFPAQKSPASGSYVLVPSVFPQVADNSAPLLKQRLAAVFGAPPPGNFPSGAPLAVDANPMNPAGFGFWLCAQFQRLFGERISIAASAPGPANTWIVRSMVQAPYTRLVVLVPTLALPPASPGESDRLSALRQPFDLPALLASQGLGTGAALPSAPLLKTATIQLVATGPAGGTLGADSSAAQTILKLAAQAAIATIVAYNQSQDQATYHAAIQAAVLQAQQQVGLSDPYQVTQVFQPTDSAYRPYTADPSALVVVLNGLNPLLSAQATLGAIDLPNDKGIHATPQAFRQAYGNTAFTQSLLASAQRLISGKLAPILEKALPSDQFPRFLNAGDRTAIAGRLQAADPQAEIVTPVESAGALSLQTTYLPGTSSIVISLQGDSVRELTGSATFKYSHPWIRGDSLTASVAPSTDGFSTGASYGFPFSPGLGPKVTATAHLDTQYDYTTDVRLGTFGGPLVNLGNWDTGASVDLTWTEAGAAGGFTVEDTVNPHERDLRGHGPDLFLGSPSAVQAFGLTDTVALAYDGPAAASGNWSAGANFAFTHWFAQGTPSYGTVQGSFSVRRVFAVASVDQAYVELRGTAGTESGAAPRIDFLRLGGDQWLRGLQDGELAGRSSQAVALEGGPNVGAIVDRLSHASSGAPAFLDNLYLYGALEQGRVGRQGDAGDDFNPHLSATSFGIGARLMGVVPAMPGGGSIAAGYAWSPTAIRASGRFFVSAFFFIP